MKCLLFVHKAMQASGSNRSKYIKCRICEIKTTFFESWDKKKIKILKLSWSIAWSRSYFLNFFPELIQNRLNFPQLCISSLYEYNIPLYIHTFQFIKMKEEQQELWVEEQPRLFLLTNLTSGTVSSGNSVH